MEVAISIVKRDILVAWECLPMFSEELNFFIGNQEKLVKEHFGKALVIKGTKICAVYDSPLEAYLQLQRDHQLGRAMIQVCLPGPEAYTSTIS